MYIELHPPATVLLNPAVIGPCGSAGGARGRRAAAAHKIGGHCDMQRTMLHQLQMHRSARGAGHFHLAGAACMSSNLAQMQCIAPVRFFLRHTRGGVLRTL
jgi:hypothetical protein